MQSEKARLLKSFGLSMAVVLVVSNIIGSGVFKKVAPMSELLLSPGLVILAWVLAGIITLFGVLTVAEAGVMFPHSGGAYSWLEKMYGKTISFFYGWSCFTVIQSAAIASIAFVFAGAAGTFIQLPQLPDGRDEVVVEQLFMQEDSVFARLKCGDTINIVSKDTFNIPGSLHGITTATGAPVADTSYFADDSLVVVFPIMAIPTEPVIPNDSIVTTQNEIPDQIIIKKEHKPHGFSTTSFLGGYITPFSNIGAKMVACLLIIVLTVVNILGAKKGGNISQIFTWIIVTCIVLIIGAGLCSAVGSIGNFNTNSVDYPPKSFAGAGLGATMGFIFAMVLAMRNAFWGYEGWISLGFVGEEIRNPEKNIPRALIIGILIVIVSYVLLNFTYLFVMPIDELLTEVNKDENSIAAVVVMNKIFGSSGAYIISAMILVSTLGCTNTTILTASRIYYAMAQRGLFFKKAAYCHPKNNTPSNSLIFQCIWACVLVFSGSFDMLTDLLIFAAFIFYGLIVFGVIVLRYKMKDTPRPYKTIGYPVVPVLFVLFCIVLVGISIWETKEQALIGLGLILSGLPFYLLWRKRATPGEA